MYLSRFTFRISFLPSAYKIGISVSVRMYGGKMFSICLTRYYLLGVPGSGCMVLCMDRYQTLVLLSVIPNY